ncbi:MAG: ATP-dependent DNA helicase UvrD2 [Acidimicrobiales bacterium]
MDLLDGLDPSQRHAVTVAGGPLGILAPAGSGKTSVLTRRIASRIVDGSADPAHVLALTFTRKAANELNHRLNRLGVRERLTAGTFHAVAYSVLRQRWADERRDPPALLEKKGRLLGPLLGGLRTGRGAPVTIADVANEIDWAKARLIAPDRYEGEALSAGRRPPIPAGQVAELYRRYEERKRKERLVDFDDLLDLCATAIERDAEFAAAQRWRFQSLFVDEFQDVNPAQHRVLEAWRGDRLDLCVVGDPNQAIYGWNGADASYLRDFPRWYPGATVVRLSHSYRSSPQVLAAAHAVLVTASPATPPPVPTRGDGPPPAIHAFVDELAEARGIAGLLRDARAGGRAWSQLAVLTRTNAQLVAIERALRSASIPCRLRGSASLLEQPAVIAWRRERERRPGETLRVAIADLDEQLAEAIDTGALVDDRVNAFQALTALAHEHLVDEPTASVAGFLAWLTATLADSDLDRAQPAVELATFHAAKGLEWPLVVIAGAEQGYVPIAAAKGEARDEEVRLLYVAITRAARELHITWAARRTIGSRTLDRQRSPLVEPIERSVRGSEPVAAPPKSVSKRATAPVDPVLLTRLKAWRSVTAKAARVPAYVVFADATLEAVAHTRPRTLSELRGLPGIGPVKVTRYGENLLALVAGDDTSPA